MFDLLKRCEEARKEAFRAFVDQRVDEALQRFRVARTEDVESLSYRREHVESKVNDQISIRSDQVSSWTS